VRLDDVRLRIEVEIPYGFEQHRPSNDAVKVAHQKCDQLELARLQIDRLAAARDCALEQVHLQITRFQHGGRVGERRAPGERIDAGEHLGEGERLDQIIVAARFKAADAVADPAVRNSTGLHPGSSKSLDQADAVEARQHAIDNQHIVPALGGEE
jgi:hypothetical protein